jgi:hypothetical protein
VLKKSTPHNFMKTLEELQEDVFESGRLVAKINEQYKSAKKVTFGKWDDNLKSESKKSI